ncbi:MAG TPA: cytochrome P460 family protein [Thermoanaerobaculia bacterium]|nr:cytochrome P460 family protein [Thermoanaerobaculia bacterium]
MDARRGLAALGLALLGGSLLGLSGPPPLSEHAALRDFASWPELTAGPYKVPRAVWVACVPEPATQQYHPGETLPTGTDRFIRVYANPTALPLMRSPRGAKFPAGSVIAKAKLIQGSDRLVSVAFMIKRQAGFNPASLDWEFRFFAGDSMQPVKLDATSGCQRCHGDLKEGDGIFGSYLAERQGQAGGS